MRDQFYCLIKSCLDAIIDKEERSQLSQAERFVLQILDNILPVLTLSVSWLYDAKIRKDSIDYFVETTDCA